MFVISIVLVLPCNNDGRSGCLSVLLKSHMELEQVLGILDGSSKQQEQSVAAQLTDLYVMQAAKGTGVVVQWFTYIILLIDEYVVQTMTFDLRKNYDL